MWKPCCRQIHTVSSCLGFPIQLFDLDLDLKLPVTELLITGAVQVKVPQQLYAQSNNE